MLIAFTKQEQDLLEALEAKYIKLFDKLNKKIHELRPEPKPDTDRFFDGLSPIETPDEWEAAIEREAEVLHEWEFTGSTAWRMARIDWWKLTDMLNDERGKLFNAAEQRQFDALGNDSGAILEDAKNQVNAIMNFVHENQSNIEGNADWENYQYSQAIAVGTGGLRRGKLNAYQMRRQLQEHVKLHLNALDSDKKRLDELQRYIIASLESSPYFNDKQHFSNSPESLPYSGITNNGKAVNSLMPSKDVVRTRYPKKYITPVDKVSNLAFMGSLNTSQLQSIAMQRRGSRRNITALVSVDFEGLKDDIKIQGRKELTAYDREVHDAIITLYVDGENEYITPQMIYQTMTGNQNAFLNPKQAAAISESITKCLYSRVIIDADEEARAYGFDSFRYDGALISGERVIASLNGTELECLHLLRKPVLYDYADRKKQIGRFDMKLLNSPVSKNEETIMLQGYLFRRILSMKANQNLSRTIVYETIYNQLGVETSLKNDASTRKKKMNIRRKTKEILNFWAEEKFISSFEENQKKSEIYSLCIAFK